MFKEYISSVLIIALLLQFGCYSGRIVTAEEVRTNNDIDELTVMKSDSSRLYFEKPEFTVVKDTLTGRGRIISAHSQLSGFSDYFIPLSDIDSFETSEFDPVKTLIFTGLTVGVVFLILITTKPFKWGGSGKTWRF